MKKERVLFKVKGSCIIQLGHLVKDSQYDGKLKVVAADGKSSYSLSQLKKLKKF